MSHSPDLSPTRRHVMSHSPDLSPLNRHPYADMYNDGTKVVDSNFDDPRLTDYDTLLQNLADLRSGKATQIPIYDFKQSCRVGYTTQDVPRSRILIIEGIYALSDRLRWVGGCPINKHLFLLTG